MRHLVEDALFVGGVRKPLDKKQGKKRHEFQADHGFRKFFETVCIEQARIDPLHVDFLEGHDTGLRENYHRGTDEQLFEFYLKAIPYLSLFEHQAIHSVPSDEEALKKTFQKKLSERDATIESLMENLKTYEKRLESYDEVIGKVKEALPVLLKLANKAKQAGQLQD